MMSVPQSNCQACSSLDHCSQNTGDFCAPNFNWTCSLGVLWSASKGYRSRCLWQCTDLFVHSCQCFQMFSFPQILKRFNLFSSKMHCWVYYFKMFLKFLSLKVLTAQLKDAIHCSVLGKPAFDSRCIYTHNVNLIIKFLEYKEIL